MNNNGDINKDKNHDYFDPITQADYANAKQDFLNKDNNRDCEKEHDKDHFTTTSKECSAKNHEHYQQQQQYCNNNQQKYYSNNKEHDKNHDNLEKQKERPWKTLLNKNELDVRIGVKTRLTEMDDSVPESLFAPIVYQMHVCASSLASSASAPRSDIPFLMARVTAHLSDASRSPATNREGSPILTGNCEFALTALSHCGNDNNASSLTRSNSGGNLTKSNNGNSLTWGNNGSSLTKSNNGNTGSNGSLTWNNDGANSGHTGNSGNNISGNGNTPTTTSCNGSSTRFQGCGKIKFNDVSYHNKKSSFVWHVTLYSPQDLQVPVSVHESAVFKVFARKKQDKKRKRSQLSSIVVAENEVSSQPSSPPMLVSSSSSSPMMHISSSSSPPQMVIPSSSSPPQMAISSSSYPLMNISPSSSLSQHQTNIGQQPVITSVQPIITSVPPVYHAHLAPSGAPPHPPPLSSVMIPNPILANLHKHAFQDRQGVNNAKSDGLRCGYSANAGVAAAAAAAHGEQQSSAQQQYAHFAQPQPQPQQGITVQRVVQGSVATQMALGASSAVNGTMVSVGRPAKRAKRSSISEDHSIVVGQQQQQQQQLPLPHVSIVRRAGTLPIAVASSCSSVPQQPVAPQQQHRVMCASSEFDDEHQPFGAAVPLAQKQNTSQHQQQDKNDGDICEFSMRLKELLESNKKLDQSDRAKAIELALYEFWKFDPLNTSRIMFASLQKMVNLGLSRNHHHEMTGTKNQ